jgi:RNA polymerase-binding transcription factor DksA
MTKSHLHTFQKQLLELQGRLLREDKRLRNETMQPIGGTENDGLSNAPLHSPVPEGHEHETEVAFQLMDNVEHTLAEINAAQERITRGSYGVCEQCQHPISLERLKILPYTRYCIGCEKQKESESGS